MSSDAKTQDAAFLLAGSAMVKMTVATRRMNQKRSVLRGHVSRTSLDVRITAAYQDAGSATMTTTAGTTLMKTNACLVSVQKVSLPARMAAVLLGDGSAMEIMTALMDLMSMAVT